MPGRPDEAADTATTYRAAAALDHLSAVQVNAPSVDVAVWLAVAHHIDGHVAPPSAGASFGLVVITLAPDDPKAPYKDPIDEAAMCRLNVDCWPTASAVH